MTELIKDFAVIASISGFVSFGASWLLSKKNYGLSSIISGVLCVSLIFFLFPNSEEVNDLGSVSEFLIGLIFIAIVAIFWAFGAILAYFGVKHVIGDQPW